MILVENELWLWRNESGQWCLSIPWITKGGRGMPGAVATSAHLRVLNPGTEIELRVWVKGCGGCEALRQGHAEGIAITHSHGPIA